VIYLKFSESPDVSRTFTAHRQEPVHAARPCRFYGYGSRVSKKQLALRHRKWQAVKVKNPRSFLACEGFEQCAVPGAAEEPEPARVSELHVTEHYKNTETHHPCPLKNYMASTTYVLWR